MDISTRRKRTSIYMRPQLVKILRENASKQNISLSGYVETLLYESIYNEPNETTIASIEDAKRHIGLEHVDMSSFESFMNSMSI